jgi:hypothetical protein
MRHLVDLSIIGRSWDADWWRTRLHDKLMTTIV